MSEIAVMTPATLVLAIVSSLVLWVIGEALGEVFTGGGTDPDSGPPRRHRRNRDRQAASLPFKTDKKVEKTTPVTGVSLVTAKHTSADRCLALQVAALFLVQPAANAAPPSLSCRAGAAQG
jgi:hypothetical protein